MTVEEAIKTAIEFESRLRDIYFEAAANEAEAAGNRIFKTLGNDEQSHIDYLEDKLEQWKNSGKIRLEKLESAIPPRALLEHHAAEVKSLVQRDFQGLKTQMLSKALKMEVKTTDFYLKLVDEMPPDVKGMFARFLEIEKNHILAIQFELDYVTKTGYWFDFKEFGMEE